MIKSDLFGDTAVIAQLRAMSPAIEQGARDSVGRMTLRLLKKVKQEKLSGRETTDTKTGEKVREGGVLNVKTGRLRRSVHDAVIAQPNEVIGVVSTNVKYARAHEYGFKGQQQVKAHLRMMKEAFGRSVKSPRQIEVGPHVRNVNLPERSFLRSALKELGPEILADLQKSVSHATK